jgi:long-subunit acyl-CoA synthetase (AMP-forming)
MPIVDARTAVTEIDAPGYFPADWCSGPLSVPDTLRRTDHDPTPEVRFLLRTSGTESGEGRWIALSDANVLSVVQSHLPHLGLIEEQSRVLSTLPWSHAFGLVIDLLPALLSGAEIHRDGDSGRDVARLLDLFANAGVTDFCAVPLTVKRLIATEPGREFLRSLHGGVIGGAPIDEALAEFLRTTRLRVGYGQTEASPGIALGEPGVFPRAGYLGRPLGCEVRTSEAGALEFRGGNACTGTWAAHEGFRPLAPERWHDTGDLVEIESGGDMYFVGRTDAAFKLANGRRIEPEPLENRIRSQFPEAEHLLLFSDDGETLTLASDGVVPDVVVSSALGSLGKIVTPRLVPAELFRYTPKGTLKRRATQDAVRAHVLQSPYGNDDPRHHSLRRD